MSMSLKWDGVRAGEPAAEAAADISREALAEAVKSIENYLATSGHPNRPMTVD